MEIIKRKATVSKETISSIRGERVMQVSYNNYGHLVLRFFDPNEENEDILIALSGRETRDLLMFTSAIKF